MSRTSPDSYGLRCEQADGVVRLVLDRPQSRNSLSLGLILKLDAAMDRIAADPTARVVLIAAEGPVFCSGHDLNELAHLDEDVAGSLFEACSRWMLKLRTIPQPVIARVQGHAVAAGCQLVAACDLAVAATSATFSTPGVKIGLFCGTPMVPLVRVVPAKAALEMLLTGLPIPAQRACEVGLVNHVVPDEQLDRAIEELVGAILVSSPAVIAGGKAAFYQGLGLDERSAYEQATAFMTEAATRPEAREGIAAFLEKRSPHWPGVG